MNKPATLISIMLLCMCMAACRVNNGDIGTLYGVWAMERMTVDGREADADIDAYFWKFQGDIVQITEVLPMHEHAEHLGTWSRQGDRLLLDFTHTNGPGSDPAGGAAYNPPPALLLPGRQVTDARIEVDNGKELVLSFDADGLTVRYTLRKLK